MLINIEKPVLFMGGDDSDKPILSIIMKFERPITSEQVDNVENVMKQITLGRRNTTTRDGERGVTSMQFPIPASRCMAMTKLLEDASIVVERWPDFQLFSEEVQEPLSGPNGLPAPQNLEEFANYIDFALNGVPRLGQSPKTQRLGHQETTTQAHSNVR